MINSKLKFYFYKKKGNQNNIKHIERILLSELQVERDWKGFESRGREKAILFLFRGCLSSCSEKEAEATMADPAKGKPRGGRQWWPAVLRSGSSLAHPLRAWW